MICFKFEEFYVYIETFAKIFINRKNSLVIIFLNIISIKKI